MKGANDSYAAEKHVNNIVKQLLQGNDGVIML
jgi:hypothetical protein